jgi:hypothetical protein
MNTPELFILGAVVTAIVALALGLVLYGAIMDGRATSENVTDPYPGSPDTPPPDHERPTTPVQ